MRFFSEIVRNIIDSRKLHVTLRQTHPGLFENSPHDDDEDAERQGASSKAYGLFNSGQFDQTLVDNIALSPHPADLMKEESFDERSEEYVEVSKKLLYKKVLRDGDDIELRTIAIRNLSVQFHCNFFIPGVREPIISTYGFREAPNALVRKLVRGFVFAMSSMKNNECSEFLVSSKLLFGSLGNCHFPPDTDLILIIDLQEIGVFPSHQYANAIPQNIREHIDSEAAFNYAQQTFNDSKKALMIFEYSKALTLLSKAKFYCEKVAREESELKWFHFHNLHAAVYITMASTHFKLQEYHRCVRILRTLRTYMHHDLYTVAYLEGCAYEEMGSFRSALNSFKLCLKVFPSIDALKAISRLCVKVDVINLNTF